MNRSKKKWYKRKRIWGVIWIVFLFIAPRLEWAKFRYDVDFFQKHLIEKGVNPVFKSKKLNGNTIHYLQITDEEVTKPVFVFVHGSPGALSAYEPYLTDTSLVKTANIIAIDRPGFGYSDFGTTEHSLEVQAAMLAEVLKSFEGAQKILIGHSMACPIIAKLAMDEPSLVDGLVMVAPPISPDLEPSNTWRIVLDFPLIRWFTPEALKVCNQEIIPLKEELESIKNDWPKINIPVTIIQGDEDDIVPKENAAFAKKMLVNSPAVNVEMIKGGNHFILWSEVPFIKKELKKLYQLINAQNHK